MTKKKSAPKVKRGRPLTVNAPVTLIARVPAPMGKAVREWASARGKTTSDAIRQLLELGLKAKR